jgi:hypothetical protein
MATTNDALADSKSQPLMVKSRMAVSFETTEWTVPLTNR